MGVAGAGFGTLLFPPLIHFLLEEFELSNTFLFIGVIYAHLFVSAVLYRPIEDNYASDERQVKDRQEREEKESRK